MRLLHQPFSLIDEQQSRSAHLGEMPRLTGPVSVVDYQPNWPELYEQAANHIRQQLGSAVLALDHVGSTAVPGLAAKPIIDIDLSVADAADEKAYVPLLEAAGYRLIIREPDWQQHRMLKGPRIDLNLHVWTVESLEAKRHLLFRDWLRTYPADRQRYGQLKKELAKQNFAYMYQYSNAKAALIYQIYERALAGISPDKPVL